MKKNFLFGLLAILLAGFWFGGASLADGLTCQDNTAVACIGDLGYTTIAEATFNATAGQTVTIKEGTYVMPNKGGAWVITNNITIEGEGNVILDLSDNSGRAYPGDQDTTMVSIPNGAIFSGVTLKFPEGGSVGRYYSFTEGGDLIFNNCTIKGGYNSKSNVTFDNCTFEDETIVAPNKGPYAITTMAGDLTVKNSTFNKRGRFINAFQPVSSAGDVARYTITVKDSQFNNLYESASKPAVVVKEGFGDSKESSTTIVALQYDVDISGVTFPTGDFPGEDQLGAGYYAIDYMLTGATAGAGLICYGGKCVVDGEAEKDAVSYGTLEGGNVVVNLNGTKVYSTPKQNQNWTVTFDGTGAVEVADGAKVAQPADPSKSCYHFDEWQLNGVAYDFNSVVTGKLALTSKWTYTCSSSSSSSSSSSKKTSTTDTKTTTGDTAKLDDKKTEEKNAEDKSEVVDGTDANTNTNDTNVNENRYKDSDGDGTLDNGLTKELVDAYVFAHENGITTMNSPEEADMFGPLTRIAMAKMLSQYAINVLGKTPDTTRTISFPDVSAELDAQYDNGVTLAYQLGIMGIGIDKFRPDDLVTRAEFGTALSRMLFGLADGEELYYETHLQKLMDEKIITNNNPDLQELRGYVMIMLMRSAQ